jgi:hypothetical protein
MSMLEDADARRALTGILRAAASEPEAAELIRDISSSGCSRRWRRTSAASSRSFARVSSRRRSSA